MPQRRILTPQRPVAVAHAAPDSDTRARKDRQMVSHPSLARRVVHSANSLELTDTPRSVTIAATAAAFG